MEIREDNGRQPWLRKSRAAALGFGLGATLALSPLVWAENPAGNTAGETMTSPMALMDVRGCAAILISRAASIS